jgi:hypothetical protein
MGRIGRIRPIALNFRQITLYRDHASLFQRCVSPVFVDGLHPACGNPNANKLFQFRHPDAALVQIRTKRPWDFLGYVPAYASLFLRHTTAMNNTAARNPRTCDAANL